MPIRDPRKRRQYQKDYYYKRTGQSYRTQGREKRALVQFRIEESIIARVQKLVQEGIATGKYPWKTNTACWKALILGGFENMRGDEFVDEMLPYLRSMSHIDGIRAHRAEAQAALSRFKTEISELLGIKANDEAATYFHSVLADFDSMPPNVWRDWLIREVKKSFPTLLKQTPKGVSFLSHTKHATSKPKRSTTPRRH